jgi:hypothetical protein
MPVLHEAKYPVVDPVPSVGKAVKNFNFRDVTTVGALGVGGYLYGWMTGSQNSFLCCCFMLLKIFFLFAWLHLL